LFDTLSNLAYCILHTVLHFCRKNALQSKNQSPYEVLALICQIVKNSQKEKRGDELNQTATGFGCKGE